MLAPLDHPAAETGFP